MKRNIKADCCPQVCFVAGVLVLAAGRTTVSKHSATRQLDIHMREESTLEKQETTERGSVINI